MKNPLKWFRKKPSQKKNEMFEKISSIDDTVADIWMQLAEMKEQQAQRPGIVLAMPTENGMSFATFEPFESTDDGEEVQR